MKPSAFDRLSRTVGLAANRRTALAGLAGAITAAVTGLAPAPHAEARPRICRPLGRVCFPDRGIGCCRGATCRAGRCRCPKRTRRCGNRCLPKARCCRHADCPGNLRCAKGRCTCAAGQKRCQKRCIAQNACCRDAECGPLGTCEGGSCVCAQGAKRCEGRCYAGDGCCGNSDCDADQACNNHVCVHKSCGEGGPCRVFITSATYTGDLGGLSGADAKCQALADGSPLARGGTYKAWLSVETESPSTRFTNVDEPGAYELVTGEVVASGWSSLTSGSIDTPIIIDEAGLEVGTSDAPHVLTKTLTNGEYWPVIWSTCGDWASTDGETAGGDSRLSNSFWSQGFLGLSCANEYRLYCFEQK